MTLPERAWTYRVYLSIEGPTSTLLYDIDSGTPAPTYGPMAPMTFKRATPTTAPSFPTQPDGEELVAALFLESFADLGDIRRGATVIARLWCGPSEIEVAHFEGLVTDLTWTAETRTIAGATVYGVRVDLVAVDMTTAGLSQWPANVDGVHPRPAELASTRLDAIASALGVVATVTDCTDPTLEADSDAATPIEWVRSILTSTAGETNSLLSILPVLPAYTPALAQYAPADYAGGPSGLDLVPIPRHFQGPFPARLQADGSISYVDTQHSVDACDVVASATFSQAAAVPNKWRVTSAAGEYVASTGQEPVIERAVTTSIAAGGSAALAAVADSMRPAGALDEWAGDRFTVDLHDASPLVQLFTDKLIESVTASPDQRARLLIRPLLVYGIPSTQAPNTAGVIAGIIAGIDVQVVAGGKVRATVQLYPVLPVPYGVDAATIDDYVVDYPTLTFAQVATEAAGVPVSIARLLETTTNY